MSKKLQGTFALITGSGRGMGYCAAPRLSAQDASVIALWMEV